MPFSQKDKEFLDKLYNKVTIEDLKLSDNNVNNVAISMLRLDNMHPMISGNKIFKLLHYLQKARETNLKIITYGGAYSNHLAATASICKDWGIGCVGIVRGEKAGTISHTLQYVMEQGMELQFISREIYDAREAAYSHFLTESYGEHVLIPEGGFGEEGVMGAQEIRKYYKDNYTHIICPVGTGTTIAGLIKAAEAEQIIGISVVKDSTDVDSRIKYLLQEKKAYQYCIVNDYNFGGYARRNSQLISFMNEFYDKYSIPLDFVYTAKMMYGVIALLKNNFFKEGSKILCLHTGGLQGNLSLPVNSIHY